MKYIASSALSFLIVLVPGMVQAQDAWPERTITFVVPYAPGGYTDLVGRLAARYVEKALGQPVVVENRPGAGGIVGTQAVATAAPDGYTFCVCSVGAVSVAPFAQKLGYDPIQDLAPVGIVSTIVQAVIGAPATAAVVSGEIDFAFANMTDALPQIEAGTVRGLAVTSLERSPYFPDLPSVHEAAVPTFIVETWNGIIAPSKTPEPVIRKLSQILIKMADDPEVKEAMRRAGASTVKTTPEQYRSQIQQEMTQWKPLIAEIADREKK